MPDSSPPLAVSPDTPGRARLGEFTGPVVGVGASAGGLEAISQLLRAMPERPGMAVVLVQHLDPNHESGLVGLLSRVTALRVIEAGDGMEIGPDHVYVIPPNAGIVLRGGRLQLNARGTGREPHRPIDRFLCSLAEECAGQAIAVILSGNGSDGTLGVEAIKAAGGITFAQDQSAASSGMPHSAIHAGCVDFVLPPQRIAAELVRIGQHPLVARSVLSESPTTAADPAEGSLAEVLGLLLRASGVDFAGYKQTTLRRRITRRMVVRRIDRLEDYAAMLQHDAAEVEALFQDVLIHVTSFFRDSSLYEAVSKLVFPALLEHPREEDPIRAWVPGCSTGEEVYSLAICLLECLGDRSGSVPVRLFGTDVSEGVVLRARAGRYPETISAQVSPQRLGRFFQPIPGGYQIRQQVRDLCVFARQDASRDPPFSNLDLISCRNLLIYLGTPLQKRLLPTFHYALKADGFLLLGRSETVGLLSDLFTPVDEPNRIYRRKPVASRTIFDRIGGEPIFRARTPLAGRQSAPAGDAELLREADRVLLRRYAPAGVLVDGDLEILQFRGDTGRYLSPAPGVPSLNLLSMARDGLWSGLREAIGEARESGREVRRENVMVRVGGAERRIDLVVVPTRVPIAPAPGFLVLFEERGQHLHGDREPIGSPPARLQDGEREELLARELAATKDYLNEIISKLQASNEELLSANEEVLSSNEEFQSANEELQTAKEELQATNEELLTLNEELRARNIESAHLNDDLTNLITSVEIPIVMLGSDLRVRRVTPTACRVLNLLPSDVGRPISDIQLSIGGADLDALLREVVDTLAIVRREVQDRDGHWYSLCIRPYRTRDGVADGAVLMLADVDAIKRGEQAAQGAREYAESIVATVRHPLVVLDAELRVRTANQAFHQLFCLATGQAAKRPLLELARWQDVLLRDALEGVRDTAVALDGLELVAELPGRAAGRTLLLDCRRIQGDEAQRLLLLSIEDVTERRRSEQTEREMERKLRDTQKLESLGVLAGGIAHDFNNTLASILGNANLVEAGLPDDSSLRRFLEHIGTGVKRAAGLCAQMLAYAGQGRFVVKRLDLGVLVQESLQLLRVGIHRSAVLDVSLAPQLPAVLADETQLHQVVMNLVMNASESLGEKGGRIALRTGVRHADRAFLEQAQLAPDLPEGEYVYLEVCDEGCGMSPEIRARMFDPFFSTKFTGRGLGLAAVLGIVRGHSGALQVETAPGLGTTIRLLLPRAAEAAEPPAAPPREPVSGRGKGTVLVIDDDAPVCDVAAMMLQALGFRTLQARDGREGIELYGRHMEDISLVLLDQTMPGLSGAETFRELRKLRADLPVIAMSGYEDQRTTAPLASPGLAGFLAKPFRLVELADTLRTALAGSGS